MHRKIIFLGNSLYLEDKISLVIGRLLQNKLSIADIEVEVTERINIGLLDILMDLDHRADLIIIVDSVYVDRDDLYGEVFLIDPENMPSASIRAPHTISLKDLLDLVKILGRGGVKFYLIGIGIRDLTTLSEDLSEYLKSKLDYIVNKVYELIKLIIEQNI